MLPAALAILALGTAFAEEGGITQSTIEEYIHRKDPQFRACYEGELKAAKSPVGGKVGTKFLIDETGHVASAELTSNSFATPMVGNCVLGVLKGIVFPAPGEGASLEAEYPFSFSAKKTVIEKEPALPGGVPGVKTK